MIVGLEMRYLCWRVLDGMGSKECEVDVGVLMK